MPRIDYFSLVWYSLNFCYKYSTYIDASPKYLETKSTECVRHQEPRNSKVNFTSQTTSFTRIFFTHYSQSVRSNLNDATDSLDLLVVLGIEGSRQYPYYIVQFFHIIHGHRTEVRGIFLFHHHFDSLMHCAECV